MRVFIPKHLCWRPDIPDFRDLFPNSPEIRSILPDVEHTVDRLPQSADLSHFFISYPSHPALSVTCPSSIVCTKLVEYFHFRCAGRIEPLSSRYVMQAVSRLLHCDCSGIRANLKAIRHYGIPSLSSFESTNVPLNESTSDEYRSLHYLRLAETMDKVSSVNSLKAWLASGFPIAFGFSVPSSLDYEGFIEFRPTYDSIRGGHAALLVGYDDTQTWASRGAFRVYCPWGDEWGDRGFGWLPYRFVEHRIALDFWTIIRPEWLQSGELFQPR